MGDDDWMRCRSEVSSTVMVATTRCRVEVGSRAAPSQVIQGLPTFLKFELFGHVGTFGFESQSVTSLPRSAFVALDPKRARHMILGRALSRICKFKKATCCPEISTRCTMASSGRKAGSCDLGGVANSRAICEISNRLQRSGSAAEQPSNLKRSFS